MLEQQKSPLVLADLASRKQIYINPSIAHEPIVSIVCDADWATKSDACAALRGYFVIGDFFVEV